jgi:hypothetical protein
MVRPLTRYQDSGLISADVPRLDFASAREAERLSQTVTGALDKLSQFAFGKVQAQKEAQNKILGIQLRGELEAQVQRRFAELNTMVATGQLTDFGQIQEEVRALSGYANELAKIDPSQANGLLTNISAGGRALLAKSSDVLVKAYGSQTDQITDQMVSDVGANLKVVYDVADSLDTVDAYVNGVRGTVFSMATNNPTTLDSKMGDFEKANVAARNSSLVDYFSTKDFAGNPYEAMQKLRANEAGSRSELWKRLPEEDREKIVQNVLKRQADNLQAIERADKLNNEVNNVANIADYDEYYLGNISGDQLLARLRGRGYTPGREELNAIRQGDQSGASQQVLGVLEYQARTGALSVAQVDQRASGRQISWRQANSLKAIIAGSEKSDVVIAKRLIGNAFVPNPLDPNTRNSHERRAEVESQLLLIERQARIEGRPFDVVAEAERLIAARRGQEDVKQLEALQTQLRKTLEENGIVYRDDITVEDLRNGGVKNQRVLDRVNRLLTGIRNLK